jgi:hypothetical protein
MAEYGGAVPPLVEFSRPQLRTDKDRANMFIDLKKTLFLLAAVPLAFGACGDDDDGDTGGNNPDATVDPIFDAAPDDPDAAPDTTFGGTVSLAEVSVTNPAVASLALSGAVVNISFTDPADETVAPQPGYENNVGACKIFVYDLDAGDVPAKASAGGPVTVAGTNGSTAASAFGCDFDATAETYLCSSADDAASGMMPTGASLTPTGGGDVTLSIPGADFSNETYVGMQIQLTGFPNAAGNGLFGIKGAIDATSLVIFNSGLAAPTTLIAESPYQTLIGAGPISGGFDFLDNGTADVLITKAAIIDVPAIDTTLTVNGSGFDLDNASTLPHAVPVNGDPATFSCGGAGGTCGVAAGFLKGIIVFGETTDGVVSPANPTAMPDPVSKFATFQCSGIGAEAITLDAGAMALIMGTTPTRIQTSVTYANAELSGSNTIVMSHGVVGFTDVPVAK